MNKLPPIYKEEINTRKEHNQTICYVQEKDNIKEQINNLFKDISPMYLHEVLIKTPINTWKTRIQDVTEEEVITINKEKIKLKDIEMIKRIS